MIVANRCSQLLKEGGSCLQLYVNEVWFTGWNNANVYTYDCGIGDSKGDVVIYFSTGDSASKINQRSLFIIVRTCVRAEEATSIVRTYTSVTVLYSYIST